MLVQQDTVHCGYCQFPKELHREDWDSTNGTYVIMSYGMGVNDYCFRSLQDVGRDTSGHGWDYVVTPTGETLPLVEYNGEPSIIEGYLNARKVDSEAYVAEDETDYVSPVNFFERLERYTDRFPSEHTVTLEQYLQSQRPAFVTDDLGETLNTKVEGFDGFLNIKVLDEVLTRKHHAHILNVYRDKSTNNLRCGSVEITQTFTSQGLIIHAKCVNTYEHKKDGTLGHLIIHPWIATRKEMEDFTWAVIAHGNNHSAKFFRTRETFYALSPVLSDSNTRELIEA